LLLILVSRFKFDILWMTMHSSTAVIDPDTFAFLLNVFPPLRSYIVVGLIVAFPC
jgi:hypothetical protein